MKKEKTVKVRKIGNFLEINGKWYFPKMHSPIDSGKTLIFKEVNKNAIKENIAFLKKSLIKYVDKDMILEDALSDLKPSELANVTNALRTDKKLKVQRRYGCVELVVGNTIIPIR